jgi:hypothetical protein
MQRLFRRIARLEALSQPRAIPRCMIVHQYGNETIEAALAAEGCAVEGPGWLVLVFRRPYCARDDALEHRGHAGLQQRRRPL